MKTYGATIQILIPMSFSAKDINDAKKRTEEVGRSVLNEKFRNSDLVKITATHLQEIVTL